MGLLLVTVQVRVVEFPTTTLVRVAVTSTSGGTAVQQGKWTLTTTMMGFYPKTIAIISTNIFNRAVSIIYDSNYQNNYHSQNFLIQYSSLPKSSVTDVFSELIQYRSSIGAVSDQYTHTCIRPV